MESQRVLVFNIHEHRIFLTRARTRWYCGVFFVLGMSFAAHVVADNIRHPFFVRKTMARYVAYMHDPANGFRSTTLPIGAGIEYSVFEG
jgi:hypothetical protein